MLKENNILFVLEHLTSHDLSLKEYSVLVANSKGNQVIDEALALMIKDYYSVRKGLVDKGYLNKQYIRTSKAYTIPDLRPPEKNFEEFWKAYPSSDKFGSFPKTRVLRSNKSKARTLYNAALKEYSHDTIMMALEHDVKLRQKSSSLRNEMKFMPAITSWLSKSAYEAIIEDLGDEEDLASKTGPRYDGEVN